MVVLNPFRKYDLSDFHDVYVPLDQAPPRHASVVAENQRRRASIAKSEEYAAPAGKVESNDNTFTIESLRTEVDMDTAASGHDTAYDRKSKVINKAIQDIGMGPYQWKLFILCGFGWLADNLWLQGLALTLPQMGKEFGISTTHVRFTTLATFVGLCFGALFWGTAADAIGRRPAFNTT